MNKVITINLNGRAYQLEEEGYDALRAYITEAQSRLADDPGKDEIIADLEQAIAEKCDRRLNAFKTVVSARELADILQEMGPVQRGGAAATATESKKTETKQATTAPKRLHLIREGAMLGGVCKGVAVYFNVDVTFVRIIWVLLVFVPLGRFLPFGSGYVSGSMILIYLAMYVLLSRENSATTDAAKDASPPGTLPRRLYRIREGAMLGGVCNGVAAYFNVDVTLVRVIWALLIFLPMGNAVVLGNMFLVYVVMWVCVPRADTAQKEAAARGIPFNAQDVINRAQKIIDEAGKRFSQEFSDKQKWREWKWQWKQEWKRGWRPYPPPPGPGVPVGSPFLGTLSALLTLGWVLTLISLIATRTIFGWAIPSGLHLWLAIIILFFAFSAIASPLKAARYMHYRGYWYYGSWHALADILGTIFVIVAAWWAYTHLPAVHDFINNLPAELSKASDKIAQWINDNSHTPPTTH